MRFVSANGRTAELEYHNGRLFSSLFCKNCEEKSGAGAKSADSRFNFAVFAAKSQITVRVRRHFHPDEVARFPADGALLGGLGAVELMAAVHADPAAGHIGNEQLVLAEQPVEGIEAARVAFFDLGNQLQLAGDLREALVPGRSGKGRVELRVLLRLVLRGGLQQGQGIGGGIHREAPLYENVVRSAPAQEVREDLGVLLLLVGGVAEDGGDHGQPIPLRLARGKGVAVSGQTLPGQGPHQVLLGVGVLQVHAYSS